MIDINKKEIEAACRCVDAGVPFALLFKPGSEIPDFFAQIADTTDAVPGLRVSFFAEPVEQSVAIAREYSADTLPEILPAPGYTDISPLQHSTPFMNYYAGAMRMIGEMKSTRGKTVLSRLISLSSTVHPIGAAITYFNRFPDTFRAVYFTRETGLWIVATPELLLSSDSHGRYKTMSLAGTRPKGCGAEWDTKNIEEHEYVTDHIRNVFIKNGLKPEVSEPESLAFGAVEHLCERISASGDADFLKLMEDLSPTPAVCGTPRRVALRRIVACETHRRNCYGGWIAVGDENGIEAYVNLRCALVAKEGDGIYRYNIYAGGGLTADSSPLDEWNEAGSKAMPLYNAAGGDQCSTDCDLVYDSLKEAFIRSIANGTER